MAVVCGKIHTLEVVERGCGIFACGRGGSAQISGARSGIKGQVLCDGHRSSGAMVASGPEHTPWW